MSEKTLTDTMLEHATVRAARMLTLVDLTLAEGEARARELRQQGYIVAPEAAQLVAEARILLMQTTPELTARAMYGLLLASSLEPLCYAKAFEALQSLVVKTSREVVDAELHHVPL